MELSIELPQGPERVAMTGVSERNLKLIREALGVRIGARNGSLRIEGDEASVARAAQVLDELATAARNGEPMEREELIDAIADAGRRSPLLSAHSPVNLPAMDQARHDDLTHGLDIYLRGRRVKPMTSGQQQYMRAMYEHDLTFCCGPAGTGKTYLAVAVAAAMLKRAWVRRIVLVRPAVEAGEKLGFLPGTMQDKVNPYLRPLLDALHDMMDFEQVQRFMAADVIEIIPLAFMRGRTLNDAIVILDEAQNTTRSQMLMFLTRLGHGSKMVVTGDTSQIDLEDPTESGLIDAVHRLRRTEGIAFATLGKADIVRHSLVQRVVEAYGERQGERR